MFRKTDQFDTARIQEHIAAIKFLSDTLLLSTQKHHVSSHISVLLNAIETFEKHRFSDYTFNKTKRAEQVLNTRKIFNELYKNKLKKSSSSIIANALKMELKDYAHSVKSHVKSIQDDLTSSLQNRFETDLVQQEVDLLDHDLDLLSQEAAAYSLADSIASLQESDAENIVSEDESSDEYIIIPEEQFFSDEEFAAKPYLQGSFNSDSDSEYTPSENESDSDNDFTFDSSDVEAESNEDSNERLLTSPQVRSFYRSWLNQPWSNNNSDAENSMTDDEDMDYRPTEHRFSS